ncbi:MAG: glycosyltransferase [Ferruginibacter sp.]
MIIVINSNHFIPSSGNDFLAKYFLKAAAKMLNHQFIFITNTAINLHSFSSDNIINIVSVPKANNPLMWKIWLNYQLPAIAKKNKADIVINTGSICSLRLKIPQWLFISDLSFLTFPAFFSKGQMHFIKKNMHAFLQKANHIAAGSDFIKEAILKKYPVAQDKINVFGLPIDDLYQPIDWKEKELIKEKYAEGKEYFLFTGEIHVGSNLVNLLKAFSFFKKRQKSNMQLIIAGKMNSKKDPFFEMYKTYKYRKEVSILTNLTAKMLAEITGAAYAFLYPVAYDSLFMYPLQAMQCQVPVVTTETVEGRQLMGDAALYADPSNFEDIADKMMLLFKDEGLRSRLINNGTVITGVLLKTNTWKTFWKMIDAPAS